MTDLERAALAVEADMDFWTDEAYPQDVLKRCAARIRALAPPAGEAKDTPAVPDTLPEEPGVSGMLVELVRAADQALDDSEEAPDGTVILDEENSATLHAALVALRDHLPSEPGYVSSAPNNAKYALENFWDCYKLLHYSKERGRQSAARLQAELAEAKAKLNEVDHLIEKAKPDIVQAFKRAEAAERTVGELTERCQRELTAAQASLEETRNALFAVNSDNESLMRRLACAEASLEEAKKDAARVLYVSRLMDGIEDHDFHDDAAVYASAFGREEANNDDYLAAVRDAIDAARQGEVDDAHD